MYLEILKKNKTKILLDTDVISHFIKGEQILLLPKIFKEEKVVLDIVNKELSRKREFRPFSINLINLGLIREISFNNDFKVIKEYAKLKKRLGDGESACLAFCKINNDIVASSNIKDIQTYCEDNSISYYTTMDFLLEAYNKNLLTEAECDYFIYNVKSKGSILPCDTIEEYINLKKELS